MTYKLGDIVRYTEAFCRSVQYHTPPINGIVVEVLSKYHVRVWWCDDVTSAVCMNNLEIHPADCTLTQETRDNLVAEWQEEQLTAN